MAAFNAGVPSTFTLFASKLFISDDDDGDVDVSDDAFTDEFT